MNHHRSIFGEAEPIRLPEPPAPISPAAFLLWCPINCLPGASVEQMAMVEWIYQCALDQALATARPSLPERDLLAVWN